MGIMQFQTPTPYSLADHAVIIMRPTLAFVRWIKDAVSKTEFADEYKEILKEKSKQDGHIYLVPILDGDDELDTYLSHHYAGMVQNELIEWQIDPDLWPETLPEALFRQWFTVSFHELVFRGDPAQESHSQLIDSPLQSG